MDFILPYVLFLNVVNLAMGFFGEDITVCFGGCPISDQIEEQRKLK